MNKRIPLGLAAATLLASSALAGGYVAPVIQPQVSPIVDADRPSFNWTGPYAGLFIGSTKFDLKATGEIHHDAITIEHEEVTEERVVEIIEHDEITEERVVGIIEHGPVVEKIPAVTREHPEVRETVQTGSETVQVGTETVKVREDVYRDENGEKHRDENHPTGWRHVPIYEEVPLYEERPIYEERVVREAWTEIVEPEREVIVEEAWTETVTETVVIEEAWVEEVVERVVVEEAWTEVVREAWTEQLTENFSEDGNAYGLFAGYRHQWQNNFVGGIEAFYGRNSANEFSISGIEGPVKFGKDIYGAELQAGYAINRALPYAAVGYANVLDEGALTLSLGLDYAVTDRVIVGAKYTHFDIGDIKSIDSLRKFEADGNMVSLRAGLKF